MHLLNIKQKTITKFTFKTQRICNCNYHLSYFKAIQTDCQKTISFTKILALEIILMGKHQLEEDFKDILIKVLKFYLRTIIN